MLLGLLFIGYAIMDGFDLGVATLLPFVARADTARRVVINTIGPVWEGNQVWLVLGIGASFAAWPLLYAIVFSGLYGLLLMALAALVLRPAAFTFRGKAADPAWRSFWDWALFAGGVVPALVFGVTAGNLLVGLPFHLDDTLRPFYTGGFIGLFHPFAVLCGVLSVVMLVMHGGVYLALKTEGEIAARAARAATWGAALVVVLFATAGAWVAFGIDGYIIAQGAAPDAPSNPLAKAVVRESGAWLGNFGLFPSLIAAPVLGYAGALAVPALLRLARPGAAFVASSAAVFGVIASAGVSMFPFLLPSSSDPRSSLTVWDASSSRTTLFIMLVATAVFLPLIVVYTAWVFRVLRGKVTAAAIEDGETDAY